MSFQDGEVNLLRFTQHGRALPHTGWLMCVARRCRLGLAAAGIILGFAHFDEDALTALQTFTESSTMNTTPSGLQYIDHVEGDGATAAAGQHVTVHYTGWLYKDGEQGAKFDSSRDRNDPFDFPWALAWSSKAGTKACKA